MIKISSMQDSTSKKALQNILDKIYEENPSYWPNGLDIDNHDSIYLVREKRSNYPVGFVGWQERFKKRGSGFKKVGYYTIGILPEYRHRGFAKEAVNKLINEKVAGVDEVRAYIVEDNDASISLAKSLDIPIDLTKKGAALINPSLDRLQKRLKNTRNVITKKQKDVVKQYNDKLKEQEKAQQEKMKMMQNSQSAAERFKSNFQGARNSFYGNISGSPTTNIDLSKFKKPSNLSMISGPMGTQNTI